jgi:hypothetical protein
MKIFLSYKQTWVSQEELDKNLWIIKDIAHDNWDKSFIYYLNWEVNTNSKEINKKALENITKSDLIIWFINHSEKSEWQLLELWMSYALWKKILILVNKECEDGYFLSYWLKWDIITYSDIKELKILLTKYLKWK